MKKEFVGIFILIIMAGFIAALELPPEPMAFYGSVTYNGTPISNGYYLVTKIGGTICGECQIINGKYGTDYLNNVYSCIVIKPEKSPSKIEFFLGDIKLGERTFVNNEIVNLNFSTTSLPTNFQPLSDGKCDLVECSYNLIDCDASKTDVCSGNGRCDVEIGETCTFNSNDCGVCPSCGDGACNNGESCSTCSGDCGACPVPATSSSGGGGGGGGGGSSSSKPKNTTNTTIVLSTKNETITNSNLSATETENIKETNNKGITGRTIEGITNFTKSKLGIGLIIFIVLLILFVILTSDKKLRGENKKKKNIKVVKQSEKIKEIKEQKEKSKVEKPKTEKKTEPSKAKVETKKENTENPKEENKK